MRIGIKSNHHHIAGGGEACFFQLLKILQNLGDVEVISSNWLVDPLKTFGVDVKMTNTLNFNYDVFINFSHTELDEPIGKKSIAHVFYPQYDWENRIDKYNKIVTISEFSRKEIIRKWGINPEVIYPAVDIKKYKPNSEKKKQIVCVGRFFSVPDGNNKNQHVLVEAFREMPEGWKLVFVGSVQDQKYFDFVKSQTEGLDIEFKENLSFSELTDLYAESYALWSATGYNAQFPSSYEHFGIVAVEALASNCKALVHNSGGMAEISGVEKWETLQELVKKTLEIKPVQADLQKYSVEAVTEKWKAIL